MVSERIKQFLTINVTGRVFMLCTGEGVKDAEQIKHYQQSIRDSLEKKAQQGADQEQLSLLLLDELEMLRELIQREQRTVEAMNEISKQKNPVDRPPEDLLDDKTGSSASAAPQDEKKQAKTTGYKPESAALQEKLALGRKPLSELLVKDCVNLQLLTPKRAKYWAHNLSGRLVEEVEKEIVAELSKNLHENIKSYIRKNSNCNPWTTPLKQEALRMDISSVRTVKGVILLSSQLHREIRECEKTNKSGFMQKLGKIFK